MSYHLDTTYKREAEKRANQCRSSFNPKLLNAAWPKAPSVPTRHSHIKAVNHKEFVKSCNALCEQSSIATEDMEVDVDVEERIRVNQQNDSPVKSAQDSKQKMQSGYAKKPVIKDSSRLMLRARRNFHKGTPDVEDKTDVETLNISNISTAKSTETKLLPVSSAGSNSSVSKDLKSEKQDIFIIIHVSKVYIGVFNGPATSPVKVYAKKIMVQMEDEVSKKYISFRISCSAITSLEVSLTEKPFIIKLVSPVQYLSGKPNSRKSKGIAESETIVLHLGYEKNVPADVKDDLKELFLVRLAEQNLWPKEEKQIKKEEEKKDKSIESSELMNANKMKTVEPGFQNGIMQTERESSKLTSSPLKQVQMELGSLRKRVPSKENSEFENGKTEEPPHQIKVARRCNPYTIDAMDERIKTLSHEVEHYQMLAAQQRMLVQPIESKLNLQLQYVHELTKENENKEKAIKSRELEIASLLKDLKTERDLVRLLELQIANFQQDLHYRDRILSEKNEALRVRDEAISELRTSNRRIHSSVSEDKATMEETRQHLMQMQVSKENLAVELESTKIELQHARSLADTNRSQTQHYEQEYLKLTTDVDKLHIDLVISREDLVRSREQVSSLTQQLTELRATHAIEIDRLNEEISSNNILLDEVRGELDECRNELSKTPDLIEQCNKTHPKDWILERKEITLTEKVAGVGAWGNVKVGRFRGTEVAVKQIHLLILSSHNRRLFEREMTIASRCRHPCLVQFIGATNDDGTPLLVMELLQIDLRTLLGRQSLSIADCLYIGFDVIRALAYLHQFKPISIIHRDISSSNVLLYRNDNHWKAKLSDYGAANFVRLTMTRHPGALLYSAPEAGSVDQTSKLDVYSFGVLFCEMLIRELPVPENRQEQVNSIKNCEYRELVRGCLRRNIEKRSDSSQVLASFERWITQINADS